MKSTHNNIIACLIAMNTLLPAALSANGVLDQSFIPSPAASYQGNIIYRPLDGSYVDQAQTFTVGITGTLTNVEVLIEGFNQTADLLVDIRPTINGEPTLDDSAILGEVAIPASDIPGFPHTFINADFSTQNINVTSGDELAIVLKIDRSSAGGDYSWRGETGDLYDSGVAYTRADLGSGYEWFSPTSGGLTVDYGFKTFIDSTLTKNVSIKIKPRKKASDVINLRKDKNLKVAIEGDATFDALQVNPATINFGPNAASPVRIKGQDYNRDGFSDLILTFALSDTGIVCGDTEATLTGETFPNPVLNIIGTASFTVEPCP